MAIAARLLSTAPCRSPSSWPLPPSKPYLRFPSAPLLLLLRSPAAASVIHLSPPPVTPLAVACDDRHALPDSDEPRNRNPPDHPAPLLAAAAAAAAAVASPHAALALSGGSMGGCSDTSSSYSSSFSSSSSSDSFSSWSSSSDSWRSSSSSSSSPPKKKKVVVVESADLETHESVGTAASPPPPPPVALTPWEKFWISVAVVLGVGGLVFGLIFLIKRSIPPPRTISVVKLQIALGGVAAAKSFQKDLNRIAERVQGSSRRWYKFILSDTISSLHRHKDYCISTSLSVDIKDSDSWNGHFKKISLEERGKFDEETLSNLEGVKRNKEYSTKMDGSKNEYIVLTILVATDGTMDFPKLITNAADLKVALTKLYSTPETGLEGIHVLWAPQDKDDILSKERMQKDYPYLKPLSV
ncbi:FLUCTUATING-LIGHT-ACCLIMATION protein 1, chloroplastic [Oryza sativa Japonica Group]|uniref:Os08g0119300 protein n=1 Tax=Oryza sativa subsp. japonica TaxID=39947 RepID=Q0J8D0_ORYSJ|nr:uncharacterized protein LOC4344536 [Oryza sativa Japonica Group]EEE67949.1 hypothetical protein OsJ_25847 [Oryza sativa Japonica Group]BAF22785.1 Os08g0119300 [Oryza sativa Japonica Group]|eukprot:NP_001060871.1 Os08g0119300 [Oryza sativa Japonica Group]